MDGISEMVDVRWVLEKGRLNTEGDIEWMENAAKQDVTFTQIDEICAYKPNSTQKGARKY